MDIPSDYQPAQSGSSKRKRDDDLTQQGAPDPKAKRQCTSSSSDQTITEKRVGDISEALHNMSREERISESGWEKLSKNVTLLSQETLAPNDPGFRAQLLQPLEGKLQDLIERVLKEAESTTEGDDAFLSKWREVAPNLTGLSSIVQKLDAISKKNHSKSLHERTEGCLDRIEEKAKSLLKNDETSGKGLALMREIHHFSPRNAKRNKALAEAFITIGSTSVGRAIQMLTAITEDPNSYGPDKTDSACQMIDFIAQADSHLNFPREKGAGFLGIACNYNWKEVALAFVELGVPLDTKDWADNTLLHDAIRHGNTEIARILIEKGAPLDAQNNLDWTPLHEAIESENTEIARILIEKEVSLDIQTWKGKTPLHMALTNGNTEIARILIDKGAPLDIRDDEGETPLHIALQDMHLEIAEILIQKGAPLDIRDGEGETPLHIALQDMHLEIAEILIQKGAPLDIQDEQGLTPLHIALARENTEIARILIDNGAPLDIQTNHGSTPLHIALLRGNTEIARILMERGVPLDIQDKQGLTPLYIALFRRNTEIAQALIDKGVPLDTKTNDGRTLLHEAVALKSANFARILIDSGAPLDMQDKQGLTPLHEAMTSGNTEIARILIDKGVPLDTQDKRGLTPLHIALQDMHLEIAEILIQKEVPLDIQDKRGLTPLHIALTKGNTEIAQTLIDREVPLDIQDKRGLTPLHISILIRDVSTTKFLLGKGVSTKTPTAMGDTPYDLVNRSHSDELIRLFSPHIIDAKHLRADLIQIVTDHIPLSSEDSTSLQITDIEALESALLNRIDTYDHQGAPKDAKGTAHQKAIDGVELKKALVEFVKETSIQTEAVGVPPFIDADELEEKLISLFPSHPLFDTESLLPSHIIDRESLEVAIALAEKDDGKEEVNSMALLSFLNNRELNVFEEEKRICIQFNSQLEITNVYINGEKFHRKTIGDEERSWKRTFDDHLDKRIARLVLRTKNSDKRGRPDYLEVPRIALLRVPEVILDNVSQAQVIRFYDHKLKLEPGIDAKGLSRDFLSDLTRHLLDGAPRRSIKMTNHAPKAPTEKEQEILQNVGVKLFYQSYRDPEIPLGRVLEDRFFGPIVYFINHPESNDETLIAAAKIFNEDPQLARLFKAYENPDVPIDEDGLQTLTILGEDIPMSPEDTKKLMQDLILNQYEGNMRAAYAIAMGLSERVRREGDAQLDELKQHSPEALSLMIQGEKLNNQQVANRITCESDHPVVQQKTEWLKEYILESDAEEVTKFLKAVTGSPTVTAATEIKVTSTDDLNCRAETCFKKLKVPTKHTTFGTDPDEKDNKQKFLNSLKLTYIQGTDMG